MRAVIFAEYGDPSVLEVVETERPEPGPGQVRVAVRAAGVNPIDVKLRSGSMSGGKPLAAPRRLGFEVSGVVDAVGDGVADAAVGDAVAGWPVGGGYAEYALLSVYAAKPDALTWEQAAALPVAGEAAVRSLRALKTRRGETLLINGASGAVGALATQIAVADGLTVVGTAGAANLDRVRALGATATTYGPGLADRVRELAPQGVDAVLDAAGHGALPDAIALRGGVDRVVTIADPAAFDLGVPFLSGGPEDQTAEVLRTLLEAAAQGRITPPATRGMALDQAAQAHEQVEKGGAGKIVLIP
ncbi:Zinc-type alcohol dehydrogenase-like protein [Actinomadura sp. RB99]|uniref:NADP-dependent oxidoreductase n=1 Tax=Actinomadura sp. RB99 TaxID=2691577 RepID=UPI001686F65D|nr:NADP-dependent oxidoreductase [Actinomadura sp. RB99]MBD2895019.1 Zinc-type alcohol dehydrogenase-like protein [Actinomadura sp. RB99]